jgi:5-methylcytosine-specific restriction endonuclease McrBC regulatory subunit McrC
MSRVTDNHAGIHVNEIYKEEKSLEPIIADLRLIANKKISELVEANKELLVFPQALNINHDGIRKSSIINLSVEDKVSTHNIMGFVGCNKTQLTIASRFETGRKDYFLHYMLQKVFSINIFDFDLNSGNDNIWDFLLYLFPFYLKKALNQGLYKEYQQREYNDANVRGTIDVNRHIRLNIPFCGKVAYKTREHSYDNNITQLIRHTIEHIRNHAWGRDVLTTDSETIDGVNLINSSTPDYNKKDKHKVISQNLRPINHPYYTEYQVLQKICLKILRQDGCAYGQEKDKIYGLLFDGAWLWEEYLNIVLKGKNLEHPRNKDKSNKQYLFANNTGVIYPDFFKPTDPIMVADAKYKHIEKTNFSGEDDYGRSDLYQVIAYMFRFKATKGYVMFPIKEEQVVDKPFFHENFIFHENGYQGEIVKLGMKIPQNAGSFKVFKDGIKISEEKFSDNI